jgi:hypothetical protein
LHIFLYSGISDDDFHPGIKFNFLGIPHEDAWLVSSLE